MEINKNEIQNKEKVNKKTKYKNKNLNDFDNVYYYDSPFFDYYNEDSDEDNIDNYDLNNTTNFCFYINEEEKNEDFENEEKPKFLNLNLFDDYLIKEEFDEDEKKIEINNGISFHKNKEKEKLLITRILKTYYLYNIKKEVEIDFTLKAINLNPIQYFKQYKYQIPGYSIIDQVISNKNISYSYNDKKLVIYFLLKNEEEIDIKIKYTQIKITKIFKYIFYENISLGVYENIDNIYGKIKVYIKEPYIIYKFSKGNLLKSNYGYYFWEGLIPKGGLSDTAYATLKKTKWEFKMEKHFNLINIGSSISLFAFFLGQNSKILKFSLSSSRAFAINNHNIIYLNGRFIINFPIGRGNKKAFFKLNYIIENNITNEWNGDYFLKDINLKEWEKYKGLTEEILKKDENKKPKYVKIGNWVNKNIKYDKSYSSMKISIEEILKNKKGVCVHFTKLYNALLMSIGIPALHVVSHYYEENKRISTGHAFTLAKIKNKWIPLDATNGNFYGIIPCTNVSIGITKHIGGSQSPLLNIDLMNDLNLIPVD